jgi:hypothetical protein
MSNERIEKLLREIVSTLWFIAIGVWALVVKVLGN